MALPIVYQKVLGPLQQLPIPVTSATADLTTMTSPTLVVLRPDGTQVTWTPTIQSGATTTNATLLYTFVAGDLTTGGAAWLGVWTAAPFATVGASPYEFPPYPFLVVDEFGHR